MEHTAAEEPEHRHTEACDAPHQRLQVILAEAEDRVYHTMNRLVGEAYRRTLIEMVQQNGGRVLTDERSGSVINLELIVDDNSPDRSEDYHDKVAQAIASYLARHPDIEDAGAIRHRLDREWQALVEAHERKKKEPEKDTLTE